jgi:hypothetical protein
MIKLIETNMEEKRRKRNYYFVASAAAVIPVPSTPGAYYPKLSQHINDSCFRKNVDFAGHFRQEILQNNFQMSNNLGRIKIFQRNETQKKPY